MLRNEIQFYKFEQSLHSGNLLALSHLRHISSPRAKQQLFGKQRKQFTQRGLFTSTNKINKPPPSTLLIPPTDFTNQKKTHVIHISLQSALRESSGITAENRESIKWNEQSVGHSKLTVSRISENPFTE